MNEALSLAKAKYDGANIQLKQDDDVLDTWFRYIIVAFIYFYLQ